MEKEVKLFLEQKEFEERKLYSQRKLLTEHSSTSLSGSRVNSDRQSPERVTRKSSRKKKPLKSEKEPSSHMEKGTA